MHFYYVYDKSVWMQACACHSTCAEGRGQLVGVSSLLPSYGPQGPNSGHQAGQQLSLPADIFLPAHN